MVDDKHLIRKAILGNNLLWRCTFTDEYIPTPNFDLTYTFGVDSRFMSCAQRLNLLTSEVDASLEQIRAFYRTRNKPSSIYLDPSAEPSNLEELLKQRGFREVPEEEEIWHILELKNTLIEYEYTEGLNIVECKTRELFEDHLVAAMKGYHDFKYWASLLSKLYRKSLDGVSVTHYVGYLDGVPVSCATLGVYFDIAFLINVAVVPEYRRRGIHTSMMLHRIKESKKLGAKYAFYQTDFDNEASIATGRKVGFKEAFRRKLYSLEKSVS